MPLLDVGSSFQGGPGNSSSGLGMVSDQPLDFSDVAFVTVSNTSIALVPVNASAVARTVVISIKSTADTGIHISFGGTATTSLLFLPPGVYSFVTREAINAIRGGAADVITYLATAQV